MSQIGLSDCPLVGSAVAKRVNEPVTQSKQCLLCFFKGISPCVDENADRCNGAQVLPYPIVIPCASDGRLVSLSQSRKRAFFEELGI